MGDLDQHLEQLDSMNACTCAACIVNATCNVGPHSSATEVFSCTVCIASDGLNDEFDKGGCTLSGAS